jgi:hypothetical protein
MTYEDSSPQRRPLQRGHSEYGGGPGENRTLPNGRLRTLTTAEQARDMRRAGISDDPAGTPFNAAPRLQ